MAVLNSAVARRLRKSPLLRPPAVFAYRAVDRLLPAPSGPRVLGNSMPKSGTHLLAALLDQLDGMRFAGRLVVFDAADALDPAPRLRELDRCLNGLRDSHYAGAHLMYDEHLAARIAESPAKVVTMLRDPRAVVASGAHYVMDARQLKGRKEALDRFPDLASVRTALVRGHGEPGDDFYFPEIGERYRRYAGWLDSPVGITVRFEDLVGQRGGGSADRQAAQVADILAYLGYSSSEATSRELAERIFSSDTITFRSGRIDSWRQDLPADLAEEIRERCGDSMTRLNYER